MESAGGGNVDSAAKFGRRAGLDDSREGDTGYSEFGMAAEDENDTAEAAAAECGEEDAGMAEAGTCCSTLFAGSGGCSAAYCAWLLECPFASI